MSQGRQVSTRARRYALPLAALAAVACVLWMAGGPPLWAFVAHRAITAAMAGQNIPGLSVAVATGGTVRWSAGYGWADVENHVPARAETVYRWASVSKPVTAVAVMQLAERGKLDLDAPVQTYVPTFPEKPWPVTIRQLLGHLGGVRHYRGDEIGNTRHYDNFRDAFGVFQDDPLVCEPGTKHVYSTYGYTLLGAAVEGASGQPFMDYVRANIFRPSGMTGAREADLEALIPHRARGYAKTPGGSLRNARPVDFSNRTPGGGLCGTAGDAARFADAVLSGRLIGRATLAEMTTRQKTRDGRRFDYGLGWSLYRHEGHEEVFHAGNSQGAASMLFMIPDRRVVVALMTNLEGAQLLDLARAIAEAAAP